MSKNRNRAKLNKAQTNKEYKAIIIAELFPDYWDEGLSFYPKYRRGMKNTNKYILQYQVRMYRTWKHNRYTQWK